LPFRGASVPGGKSVRSVLARAVFFAYLAEKLCRVCALRPNFSAKGFTGRPGAAIFAPPGRPNTRVMAKKREKSRNLTLSVKRRYFDEILAGTKTREERAVWPHNVDRYCLMDGECTVMEEGIGMVPRPYDTITFLTGAYRGTRPRMVVEVASAAIYGEEGDDGENITYEYDDGETYEVATVVYELGAVLERPAAPAET